MIKKFFIVLVFSLVCFLEVASAAVKTYEVEGRGVIFKNDHLGAMEYAQDKAVKRAVAQAIEELLEEGSRSWRLYIFKKRALLDPPYTFVADLKMTSYDRLTQVMVVDVEVKIDQKKLAEFLEEQGIRVDKPPAANDKK